ncbi:methyltransferase domain-containing protein [Pseudaestuariivita rosea]|uniref:methyltransferase domain-containing protein n=1 Tax=Pseudaestuariivita rosea TaxID=2763263 RepID=UPI001ABAC80E|nr:methyltransferase domain-containing protein [Pseudaestuariivita rosea]
MTQPPALTDTVALRRNRTQRLNPTALFLHEEAAFELKERLNEVNRDFKNAALVAPFSNIWAEAFPNHQIVPDSEVLDLTEATHDLIIHAMSLHWANDPVGQLIQCRRALKPDGLLLAIFPGGRTLNELRTVFTAAEVQVTGGLSPRIAPMPEIRSVGSLLQRAGLALPVADSVQINTSYPDLHGLMADLRGMGEANALSARPKTMTRRALFTEADRLYRDQFSDSDGRLKVTFELICLTGWAPDASQPQPLRPGSATSRLADALGTRESPAGEKVRPG